MLWLSLDLLYHVFIMAGSYILQAEVTQRLSMAKEAASRSATVQSHEDLARKLKVFPLSYIHLTILTGMCT